MEVSGIATGRLKAYYHRLGKEVSTYLQIFVGQISYLTYILVTTFAPSIAQFKLCPTKSEQRKRFLVTMHAVRYPEEMDRRN